MYIISATIDRTRIDPLYSKRSFAFILIISKALNVISISQVELLDHHTRLIGI